MLVRVVYKSVALERKLHDYRSADEPDGEGPNLIRDIANANQILAVLKQRRMDFEEPNTSKTDVV